MSTYEEGVADFVEEMAKYREQENQTAEETEEESPQEESEEKAADEPDPGDESESAESPPKPEGAQSELTDEQVAAYLGVDLDYFTEAKGKFTDLSGLQKNLNRRIMEAAELQRNLSAQNTPQPEAPKAEAGDDTPQLDEASKKVLLDFIEPILNQRIEPITQLQRQELEAQRQAVYAWFADNHPDADYQAVEYVMDQNGWWDTTANNPNALAQALESSYNLVRANSFDPEAEVQRRVEAELAKIRGDEEKSGKITKVRSANTPVKTPRDESEILADENIPWHERMRLAMGGD